MKQSPLTFAAVILVAALNPGGVLGAPFYAPVYQSPAALPQDCTLQPANNPRQYLEYVEGHGWITRDCAAGTTFNGQDCTCSNYRQAEASSQTQPAGGGASGQPVLGEESYGKVEMGDFGKKMAKAFRNYLRRSEVNNYRHGQQGAPGFAASGSGGPTRTLSFKEFVGEVMSQTRPQSVQEQYARSEPAPISRINVHQLSAESAAPREVTYSKTSYPGVPSHFLPTEPPVPVQSYQGQESNGFPSYHIVPAHGGAGAAAAGQNFPQAARPDSSFDAAFYQPEAKPLISRHEPPPAAERNHFSGSPSRSLYPAARTWAADAYNHHGDFPPSVVNSNRPEFRPLAKPKPVAAFDTNAPFGRGDWSAAADPQGSPFTSQTVYQKPLPPPQDLAPNFGSLFQFESNGATGSTLPPWNIPPYGFE